MLNKRLIVCLDVHDKKVTKGVKFKNNVVVGEPIEIAQKYAEQGVDELVFYDITASAQGRGIDLDMVRDIAKHIFIPFSVGGGIASIDDMRNVLLAGAEKVSVNSLAIKNPNIINEGCKYFGQQCIVLGIDALKVPQSTRFPSGYQVVVKGGREPVDKDVVEWAKEAEQRGVGEICINSIDMDGVKQGYELEITKKIVDAVKIPVIASGGAGIPQHLVEVFQQTSVEAALIAGMVHYQDYQVDDIKKYLFENNIPTRMDW